MALIEFQNNSAPYLNAENLNNNFNEVNIVSKDNNEYLLRMNDKTVLKTGADGSLFASANNNNVVLRPNGHNSSVGQAILSTTGNLTTNNIDGVILKGKANITSATLQSVNGYGTVMLISSQYITVIQFAGPNTTPYIKNIYQTYSFTATSSGNDIILTNLNNWDHYIFIGSDSIYNITFS